MKLIEFTIEEMGICFPALAYMFVDHEAREEYKNLLLDNQMKFPHEHLDIISLTIKNHTGAENMLLDFEVVKTLSKLDQWNSLKDHSQLGESKIYFNAFIDKIKGNLDQLKDIPLIEYADNKEAFLSFINGNLRALINSKNKEKFAYWNNKTWQLLTDEETQIIYGNLISQCRLELKENENAYEYKPYIELCKKVTKWNTDRNTKEALNYIRRNKSHIVDLKNYNANRNIICSNDGKIINLNTGEIKKANRNDMILFTSKYNLMDKDDSIKFMNEKMDIYLEIIGKDRLEFILNLISYKLLDKSLQSAIFMIGTRATGKSTFKNIIRELLKTDSAIIPYEYMTTLHKGNNDSSRDDLLVSLDNKKVAFCSEGEEEKIISSARFKKILSNSDESARKTNDTLVDVDLQGLDIIFDTNSIPSFTTMDGAISRRLIFINFDKPIAAEKRNADYYKEEIIPNFDYVFSYFVYRAIDMIGKKLDIPNCIKNDTSLKMSELDSLLSFSMKNIAPFDDSCIKYSEFEKEYLNFCEEEGQRSVIPDDLQDTEKENKHAKRCTYIINLLKEKEGYSNIYKGKRISDGSRNRKTYEVYGITFKDNSYTDPFEDNNAENVEQIKIFEVPDQKEIQQEILPQEPIKEPITWAK